MLIQAFNAYNLKKRKEQKSWRKKRHAQFDDRIKTLNVISVMDKASNEKARIHLN